MSLDVLPVPSRVTAISILLVLGACASNSTQVAGDANADPWESLNRPIHGLNSGLDTVIIKPIAKGYEFIVPNFIRRGVTNFSKNLRMPLFAVNNLLQGKGDAATYSFAHFVFNSTFGVLGVFDVATAAGIESGDEEDFGQTFAVWGVPDGPYVVVPFLGPRTLRDAIFIPLNFLADPLYHYRKASVRKSLYALRLIDVRQRLFRAEKLIGESQDRYVSIREAYLQHRQYLVFDGDPPVDDDFYDDFLEDDDADY